MSLQKIAVALEKRLLAMPDNIDTALENVSFEAVSNVPYQTAIVYPAPVENPVYGDEYYLEQGIFRIRLMYPTGVGAGAAGEQAEKIRAWFPRGFSLEEDGLTIRFDKTPSVYPGRVIQDRYSIAVDVSYFASVFL